MDSLEDMEMDDNAAQTTPMPQIASPVHQKPPSMAPLNTNIAAAVPAQQAFRTSTPSTPNAAQAFQLYSNPTVSSVNTPALSTQSFQQSQQSPHTSIPGTPAELNTDFSIDYMAALGLGGIPMQGNQMLQDDFDFGPIGFGLASNMNEMTIDEPAKRLFSKAGGMNAQQLAYAIKNGQLPLDADLQKKLREQQLVGGLGGPVIGFPDQENKPFKCPVIGCEKAYKNQNGLKYHKQVSNHMRIPGDATPTNMISQHGHNNQKLQENADGSFSIVDPITSVPYPGTIGMEKEKPYQCPVCGKRYKNLNGLKYHKQHSPMCNPELKLPGASLSGLNPAANVAGNLF
jgi:transcription factor SFP1